MKTRAPHSRLSRANFAAVAPLAVAGAVAASCGPSDLEFGTDVEGLELRSLAPATLLPGTSLRIEGSAFVDAGWAELSLRVEGELEGEGDAEVSAALPLEVRDAGTAYARIDEEALIALGGEEGLVVGDAWIAVESALDGQTYESDPTSVELELRSQLVPGLETIPEDGVFYVNDRISIRGEGLLLGDEGRTVAVARGCFRPGGEGACEPIEERELEVEPRGEIERDRGEFVFSPEVAGIEPGVFEGEIALENRHEGGGEVEGSTREVSYRLAEPSVAELATEEASLGQYVFVRGAGFVGKAGGHTILEFEGRFSPDGEGDGGAGDGESGDGDSGDGDNDNGDHGDGDGGDGDGGDGGEIELALVAEPLSGRRARFVMAEDEGLGRRIDLRAETGELEGELRAVTLYGESEVTTEPIPVSLRVAPLKQVVEIRFLDSYVESLRAFGLRAVDGAIRDRVLDVVKRDYATINLEARRDAVDDFALHAVAEIAGPDPNGLGLLGYDNTPGKDVGLERLHDRIGGVNAITQEDGFPGYGGVFIESFLQLSAAEDSPLSDDTFDAIFDPFRPSRGGEPIRAEDLAEGVPAPSSGEGCPAPDGARRAQIECAIWVLGSLIGTTLSHEIGHSLGLADPEGTAFHNQGNYPNRLMDAGQNRPFLERAELKGEGPAQFCDEAYDYLREILPADEAPDRGDRPPCS